jgi:hypothetical protein
MNSLSAVTLSFGSNYDNALRAIGSATGAISAWTGSFALYCLVKSSQKDGLTAFECTSLR